MFFHLNLLHQQNRGRLGIAWIAATRGVSHVKKSQIIESDIDALCKDITKFVATQSTVPGQRFSLRFSSILINGVVRIYRQQAIIVLAHAYRIFNTTTSFRVPSLTAGVSDDTAFDAPQTPIIRVKGKKRGRSLEKSPLVSEVPTATTLLEIQNEVELLASNFENMFTALPRADDVTLRENQFPRAVAEEYYDSLGILGPPLTNEIGILNEGGFMSLLPSIREEVEHLQPSPELKQTPKKRRIVLSSSQSESTPEIQSKNKTTEQIIVEVHAAAGEMLPIDKELAFPVPLEKENRQKTVTRSCRKLLGEMQIDEVRQRDEEISQNEREKIQEIDPVLINKKKKIEFYFTQSTRRNVYINKKSTLKLPQISSEMPIFRKDELKHLQLLNTYLIDGIRLKSSSITVEQEKLKRQPAQISEASNEKKISVGLDIPQIRHQFSNEMEASQELLSTTPLLTSTPRPSLRIAVDDSSRKQTDLGTIAEIKRPSKKRRLNSEELRIPSEVHSGGEPVIGLSPAPLHEVLLDISADFAELRQKEIVRKINCGGDKRVEMEHLCPKPVNRCNISKLFGDLLVLAKAGYVKLETKSISSELKYIRKGPKLED